jgi:hypothetical protein
MSEDLNYKIRCRARNKNGKRCIRRFYKSHNQEKYFCFQHSSKKNRIIIEKRSSKKEECCICYEININKKELMECKHGVCKDCLKKLQDNRCPICRQEMKGKLIFNFYSKKLDTVRTGTISTSTTNNIVDLNNHFRNNIQPLTENQINFIDLTNFINYLINNLQQ